MGIFRRKRHGEDVAVDTTGAQPDAGEAKDAAQEDTATDGGETEDAIPEDLPTDAHGAERGEPPQEGPGAAPSSRSEGPFDADEPAPEADRLDLGALRLPAVEGLQVQLELDEATASVTAVRLVLGESYAQLQAFAAPRSAALWAQVRTEISDSVHQQGGSTDIVDGPLGRELLARMPRATPPLRFVGVDGPRWFLRAVLSGPAATDDTAAAPLMAVVKGTVVVRGTEAMAPRELLPLRLPDAPAEDEPAEDEPVAGRAPLDPLERGPEITEVR